jgi:hypothetical protein
MAEYAAFRLLNGYKDSLDDLEDNIGIMLPSYHHISSHYSQRDPKESGVYAEICLKVLMAVCNGQDSWPSERRFFLSMILLDLGSSCIFYKDRAPEACRAYEMALRAFKPDDDSPTNRLRSSRVRRIAYHGLSAAIQALKDFYDVDIDPALITAYEEEHSKAVFETSGGINRPSAADAEKAPASQCKPGTQKPVKDPATDSFIRSITLVDEAKKIL